MQGCFFDSFLGVAGETQPFYSFVNELTECLHDIDDVSKLQCLEFLKSLLLYRFSTIMKQFGGLNRDGKCTNLVLILPFSLHVSSEILKDIQVCLD